MLFLIINYQHNFIACSKSRNPELPKNRQNIYVHNTCIVLQTILYNLLNDFDMAHRNKNDLLYLKLT